MFLTYLQFWARMVSCAARGGWRFYLWCGFLFSLMLTGAYAYSLQARHGMAVTNMVDQVSWGAYIANFTFLVGVAAAAVLLVIPAYVYHDHAIKEVVLIGEVLAVSAIVMCLLFITADLGRPDRFTHILPFIGRLHFPVSVLAWDVVVLNGYLLLNLHIPGYVLWKRYLGEAPNPLYYLPFVFVSIAWAVSIHTVTAFLYSGLGGRPFWNSAILAPRFLVSAFACGPALLIIIFKIINRVTTFRVSQLVFDYLRRIMSYTVIMNLFLLGCEVFKEFYTQSLHVASARYLFFGLEGHAMLRPYIWSAIGMEVTTAIILLTFATHQSWRLLLVGCGMTIVGIWIEKGMGLIIPGFIPDPLGEVVEYIPSVVETLVCVGVWATGTLVFTLMAKVVINIQDGSLRLAGGRASVAPPAAPHEPAAALSAH